MNTCVQVYTGDGKGKTTAALGLLIRAVGAGQRVLFCQFLKNGQSSECTVLRERFPEVVVRCYGHAGFIREKPTPEDTAAAQAGFAEFCANVTSGCFDLAIADEIHPAIRLGLITVDQVLDLIAAKPATVELILTGREAHPRILEQADLISEIVCRRHPYARGLAARRGIEF